MFGADCWWGNFFPLQKRGLLIRKFLLSKLCNWTVCIVEERLSLLLCDGGWWKVHLARASFCYFCLGHVCSLQLLTSNWLGKEVKNRITVNSIIIQTHEPRFTAFHLWITKCGSYFFDISRDLMVTMKRERWECKSQAPWLWNMPWKSERLDDLDQTIWGLPFNVITVLSMIAGWTCSSIRRMKRGF